MASSDPAPIISPTGIIHVLGYTPSEGERGVPITVRIHFDPELADAMYVRLVVGNKAVPTKVRQLPGVSYGRWQLYAAAPPCDDPKVLISVQALDDANAILDTVTFGEFSYWGERRASMSTLPRLQIPAASSSLRRRSINHLPTPSPTASDRSPLLAQRKQTRLHRRIKSQSLMRTKNAQPPNDDLYAQTPILDLVTPLVSMCQGWSPTELAQGRRLVRFAKVQDGRRLIVSCEPIPQDAFCDADAVISCIYRAEADACYVTSVDVIYLLERLTSAEFPVEEKNRIRRNLEGLRPTTVSKHKPGFGDFFQRIMEFPDPKPRNIEKDLKVFEWNLLGQALEKILSKYSIYTTNVPEADPEPEPAEPSPTSADSPELYALQLSYPPPDDPGTSRFLDQQQQHALSPHHKYDPFPALDVDAAAAAMDDFAALQGLSASAPTPSALSAHSAHSHSHSHSASDTPLAAFASPVDSVLTSSSSSSSSSAFPLFKSDDGTGAAAHVHGEDTSTAQHWSAPAPFKPGAELALENFNILAAYEVVEPGSGGSTGGGIHAHAHSPYGALLNSNGGAHHPGSGLHHDASGMGAAGGMGSVGGAGGGGSSLDFALYDSYAFQGLGEDTLASLAEQQFI